MYAQKEKLKHYLAKGNFDIKAKVTRRIVDFLKSKETLSKFRIRVDYNATPQGKMLDRAGDIIITLPSTPFEDSYLITNIHCAILLECYSGAQPIALLTENDPFLNLPFVCTIPVMGKYCKREERGLREAYTVPWCPIEEDGVERIMGREFSIPLERGVSAIRSEFPKAVNLTNSISLKPPYEDTAVSRLIECSEILVSNTLDVFNGLKDLPARRSMQIDLLMVWPVLVSEKTPLLVKDASDNRVEADFLSWWTPVDSTGFYASSGIQPSAQPFSAGAGMIVTVIGFDKLQDFIDAIENLYTGLKRRFTKLRLTDLYG